MTNLTVIGRDGLEFCPRDDFECLLSAEDIKTDPERYEMAIEFAKGVLEMYSKSDSDSAKWYRTHIQTILGLQRKAPVLRLVPRQ